MILKTQSSGITLAAKNGHFMADYTEFLDEFYAEFLAEFLAYSKNNTF
jgi:hypothetical protein